MTRIWSSALLLTAFVAGVSLLHRGVQSLTIDPEPGDGQRRRAIRSLREGAPLLVVYGTSLPEWTDHYRAEAERVARRYQSWGRPTRALADGELSESERRQSALILLGRPEANRWVRETVGETPIRFSSEGFTFGGRSYEKAEQVIQLVTLSPWNRERPLVLVAGASHESPLAQRGFRFGRRDYSILEGGRTVRYGRLREGRIDEALDVDIHAEQEEWEKSLRRVSAEHVELFYPAGSAAEPERESLAQLLADRLTAAKKALGYRPELTIRFYLYPSHETKGRLVDSVAPSHVDARSLTVHAIYSADRKGLDGAEEVGLLLDRAWGSPAQPYLRTGFARLLAGLAHEGEARRFVDLGFPPELRRLVATDERESLAYPDQVYRAFSASWVSLLRERLGTKAFRGYYTGVDKLDLDEWDEWERIWQRRLDGGPRARAKPRATQSGSRGPRFFHMGFNYAYSNGRDNGYPTARSRESLEELRGLGANAVALVPYGFSSPDRKTEIRHAGDSIRTESDESVRVATADARRLGFRVMLKPQIWLSSQDWPNEIDFDSDEDWHAWFESYESWILSYALLAEELQVDLFCVGTELTHPALEQPERFRQVISNVRRIYHGPLTYAANWYEEFEKVSFWDAVDLVGLDNYFPLVDNAGASEDELRAAARSVADRVEAVARRAGKPVIFTEVGFPSVRAAGTDDHEGSDPDLERQALLYRIIFETYWPRSWFYGLYWWKWFSDPTNAGPGGDAWTPRGKPAEGVVAEWFAKPLPRANTRSSQSSTTSTQKPPHRELLPKSR